MGQSRSHPLRADWEQVKGHAMYLGVKAKYEQNPDLARELMETKGPIRAGQSTSNWRVSRCHCAYTFCSCPSTFDRPECF